MNLLKFKIEYVTDDTICFIFGPTDYDNGLIWNFSGEYILETNHSEGAPHYEIELKILNRIEKT